MSNTPTVSVHEIEDLPLRSLFAREDREFTPWLAEPANLARLSRTLGFEMELTATEASTGSFRTDVLATRSQDGVAVVIENQFGRSDHDHFGKSLTYLAAHQASVVVWIAESFADEHRASLTWLNEHTEDEFEFWAVIPRVLKIGDSPPGLRFEVAIAPNRLVRKVRKIDRRVDESVARTRKGFWEMFMPLVKSDPVLSKCGVRYGGRLGFLWLFPEDMGDIADADPHVLVFMSLPAPSRLGCGIYCRADADAKAEARMEAAFASAAEQLRQSGVSPEEIDDRTVSVFGDFTAEETMQAAAHLGIERVRTCVLALSEELRTKRK